MNRILVTTALTLLWSVGCGPKTPETAQPELAAVVPSNPTDWLGNYSFEEGVPGGGEEGPSPQVWVYDIHVMRYLNGRLQATIEVNGWQTAQSYWALGEATDDQLVLRSVKSKPFPHPLEGDLVEGDVLLTLKRAGGTYSAVFGKLASNLGTKEIVGERVQHCAGLGYMQPKAEASRVEYEKGALFTFAKKTSDPPVSCRMERTWEEGTEFEHLHYYFKDGSFLKFDQFPPESWVMTFEVPGGFPDPTEARIILENEAREAGFDIDWSKAPDVQQEDGGRVRQERWDPNEGWNAQATLIMKDDKLIAIWLSAAL